MYEFKNKYILNIIATIISLFAARNLWNAFFHPEYMVVLKAKVISKKYPKSVARLLYGIDEEIENCKEEDNSTKQIQQQNLVIL